MRTNIAIKRWELLSLKRARCQWSIPIILATQVTDIRKMVQSQHRQIVHETLSLKKKKKKKNQPNTEPQIYQALENAVPHLFLDGPPHPSGTEAHQL
jgi:hypothetical protein